MKVIRYYFAVEIGKGKWNKLQGEEKQVFSYAAI